MSYSPSNILDEEVGKSKHLRCRGPVDGCDPKDLKALYLAGWWDSAATREKSKRHV